MAVGVLMPKVGITVESCVITKWYKKEGDAVKQGDVLFAYETDKASVEEEAKVDGTLIKSSPVKAMTYPVLQMLP